MTKFMFDLQKVNNRYNNIWQIFKLLNNLVSCIGGQMLFYILERYWERILLIFSFFNFYISTINQLLNFFRFKYCFILIKWFIFHIISSIFFHLKESILTGIWDKNKILCDLGRETNLFCQVSCIPITLVKLISY
jgi:hypothetical protein